MSLKTQLKPRHVFNLHSPASHPPLTFFCCWVSNARSKRSTLEMSRLSLQNEFRPPVRSSRRAWTNTQPNFRVLMTRCRMFSVRTVNGSVCWYILSLRSLLTVESSGEYNAVTHVCSPFFSSTSSSTVLSSSSSSLESALSMPGRKKVLLLNSAVSAVDPFVRLVTSWPLLSLHDQDRISL